MSTTAFVQQKLRALRARLTARYSLAIAAGEWSRAEIIERHLYSVDEKLGALLRATPCVRVQSVTVAQKARKP